MQRNSQQVNHIASALSEGDQNNQNLSEAEIKRAQEEQLIQNYPYGQVHNLNLYPNMSHSGIDQH